MTTSGSQTLEQTLAKQEFEVENTLLHPANDAIPYAHISDANGDIVPGFVRYFITRWSNEQEQDGNNDTLEEDVPDPNAMSAARGGNGDDGDNNGSNNNQVRKRIAPQLITSQRTRSTDEESISGEQAEQGEPEPETVSAEDQEESARDDLGSNKLSQRLQQKADELTVRYGDRDAYMKDIRSTGIEILAWDQLVILPYQQATEISTMPDTPQIVIHENEILDPLNESQEQNQEEVDSTTQSMSRIAHFVQQMTDDMREAERLAFCKVDIYEAVFYPIYMTDIKPVYLLSPYNFIDDTIRATHPYPDYVPKEFDPYNVESETRQPKQQQQQQQQQQQRRHRRNDTGPDSFYPLFIRVKYIIRISSSSGEQQDDRQQYVQDFMYRPHNTSIKAKLFPQLYHHRRWGSTRSEARLRPLRDAQTFVKETILPQLKELYGQQKIQLVNAVMMETNSQNDTNLPYESPEALSIETTTTGSVSEHLSAVTDSTTPTTTTTTAIVPMSTFDVPPVPSTYTVTTSPSVTGVDEEHESTETETESESETETETDNEKDNQDIVYVSSDSETETESMDLQTASLDSFFETMLPQLNRSLQAYMEGIAENPNETPSERSVWMGATQRSLQTTITNTYNMVADDSTLNTSQQEQIKNARDALYSLFLSQGASAADESRKAQRIVSGGGILPGNDRYIQTEDDLVERLLMYSSRQDQQDIKHRLVRAIQLCPRIVSLQLHRFCMKSKRMKSAKRIMRNVDIFLNRTFPSQSQSVVSCTDIEYHLHELLRHMTHT